jgi:hypothetical protein
MPFHEHRQIAQWGLNKDPSVLQNGASLPTPESCPPLGGLHVRTTQQTHHLKSFRLSIFIHNMVNFQSTKMAHLILESL